MAIELIRAAFDRPGSARDEFLVGDLYERTLEEFVRAFQCFFPAFSNDRQLAAREMIKLVVFTGPVDGVDELVDRNRAEGAVIDAVNALRTLAKLEGAHVWLWGTRPSPESKEILRFLGFLREVESEGRLNSVLNEFKAAVLKKIGATPSKGREGLNWDAVRAVELLRGLWGRRNGTAAPASASLNAETEYAKFLSAGLNFLGVQGEPRSAVRTWHKHRSDIFPDEAQ